MNDFSPPRTANELAADTPNTLKRVPGPTITRFNAFPLTDTEFIRWAAGLLTLAGFALRVWNLDAQSLWWDEGFSLNLAGQSVGAIIRGDFHPPLYHLLLAGWIHIAGTTDFAARYLSVVCSTLLVPLVYTVGRRLFDHLTGGVAALFVAGSPVLLWYAQETRMYILVALIYLTLIWLFHRLTDPAAQPTPARWWIAFALVELAGLYTHYFVALGIAWLLAAMLLRHHAPRTTHHATRLKPLLLSQIAVALAYLPWLPIFLSLESRYNPIATMPPTLRPFFDQVWHGYNAGSLALVGHHATVMTLSTVAGMLFGLLLILALLRDARRSNILWLLGHTLVPLAAIFALMQLRPFFHPRYVVMLAAPLLIVVARTISNPQSPISNHQSRNTQYAIRIISLLVFAVTFATAIYAFETDTRYQRDDVRGLAHHLATTAGPDDAIVFGYADYPFRRYYDGVAPATYLDLSQSDNEVAQTLANALRRRERAFLVTWNQAPVDRRGLLRWLLASAGRLVDEQPWGDLVIHTYALDRSVPKPSLTSQTADFGTLLLTGASLPASMPAAGAVPVALRWTSSEPPAADYKIALRLRDDAGYSFAQADALLVDRAGEPTTSWGGGAAATNYATLRLLRGTPPGDYTVDLVIYDATTLRRLDRQDVPGQRVELGTVRLTASDAPFLAAPLSGFTPVDTTVGDLRLKGYALDRDEVRPGGRLSVALRWQTTGVLPTAPPALRLMAGAATLTENRDSTYPVSAWRSGQVMLDWRDITVPPDAPAGPATLQVTLGGATLLLTDVTITPVDHRFEQPPVEHPLRVQFGDVAELLGYDLEMQVRAGEPVELTLYWRALRTSDVSYTVFTHLLNGVGRLVGQHDGIPVEGQRPTRGWVGGEIIVDRHPMTWKDAGFTGAVQVEIGLYDPKTGDRVPTAAGADHVILPTTVEVSK